MNWNKIKTRVGSLLMMGLAMVVTTIGMQAEPAHPQPFTVNQPDGSSLTLRLVGDEFYHFNTTLDGYTVMLNQNGYYVYVQKADDTLVPTQVVAHDATKRDASEQAFVASLPK